MDYYIYFTDNKAKTSKDSTTFPKSHCKWPDSGLEPIMTRGLPITLTVLVPDPKTLPDLLTHLKPLVYS